MPAYYYSSTAGQYTLVGAVSNSATLLNLNSVAGLPSATPFKVVLEPGQPTEEIVKVTSVAGTSLTVVRGWDGTTAVAHAAAVSVRHMITAEDFTLSRSHEDATTAHGTGSQVVGKDDAQPLTNKDLTSSTNTFPSSLATIGGLQTLTNKTLSGASNTFTNIPKSAVNSLESDLATLSSGVGANTTAIAANTSDVAALKADTGILNSGVASAASGFTIAVQQATKKGSVAMVYMRGTRSGATITGSTSGDINNVNVAVLSDPAFFPRVPVSGTTVADGQGIFFSIWTDGTVFISALGPGTDLASGAGWSVAATYLV